MRHEESKIQQACVKWFRLQYPQYTLFAIPNGGRRGKIEAFIMKGEGVLAGVADLFLAKMNFSLGVTINGEWQPCGGLFIEIKTSKGKQSPEQKKFQQSVEQQGYQYSVCRSLNEFMNTINQYIK